MRAAIGLDAHLLSCLLLFVFLPIQVLAVGLGTKADDLAGVTVVKQGLSGVILGFQQLGGTW